MKQVAPFLFVFLAGIVTTVLWFHGPDSSPLVPCLAQSEEPDEGTGERPDPQDRENRDRLKRQGRQGFPIPAAWGPVFSIQESGSAVSIWCVELESEHGLSGGTLRRIQLNRFTGELLPGDNPTVGANPLVLKRR